MNFTTNSEEVNDAIKLLNINAKVLPLVLSVAILERVVKKFTNHKRYAYPLWEKIVNERSRRDKDAWKLLDEMLQNREVILFFDYDDDKTMFLFPDGNVLPDVIANCFGFIFYITNMKNEFLLAFNDHDYLIGAGEAANWI